MDVTRQFNSSVIAEAMYFAMRKLLKITLVSGREYVYQGVPRDVYEEFFDSESAGRYYNREIKGHYQCLGETEEEVESMGPPAPPVQVFVKTQPNGVLACGW